MAVVVAVTVAVPVEVEVPEGASKDRIWVELSRTRPEESVAGPAYHVAVAVRVARTDGEKPSTTITPSRCRRRCRSRSRPPPAVVEADTRGNVQR